MNFRRGKRTVHHYQMVVHVNEHDTKEKALSLIGKKVVWTSPAGKEIAGSVLAVHGGKGAVRVRFATGMPGQAIGKKVKVE